MDAEEMDEKPTEGFRKLNFLLNQQPSPPALWQQLKAHHRRSQHACRQIQGPQVLYRQSCPLSSKFGKFMRAVVLRMLSRASGNFRQPLAAVLQVQLHGQNSMPCYPFGHWISYLINGQLPFKLMLRLLRPSCRYSGRECRANLQKHEA